MKCVYCSGNHMQNENISVSLQRKESIIIIEDVPAMICRSCGEYIVKETVAKRVLRMAEKAFAREVEVEVLYYVD